MLFRSHVDIRSPRYFITMQSGVIDFKTNRVTSKEPVTVTMKGGTIDADSMNVFDNGDRVQFEGRVRSVFKRASAPGDNGGLAP